MVKTLACWIFPILLASGLPISLHAQGASLAANPAEADFRNLSGFPEAFVPTSPPSASDNAVFAATVHAWLARTSTDDFSALQRFVDHHADSPWRMTALINLGMFQSQGGYFSKAIENFTTAWNVGKRLNTPIGNSLADVAYAQLLKLHVSLGNVPATQSLENDAAKRVFTGKTPRVVLNVQNALALRKLAPQSPAFQCGPTSVGLVAVALNATNAAAVSLAGHHALSDTNGFSLGQLEQMSQQYGLPLQLAYRKVGAVVLTPCVMHTKLNHYSALVKSDHGNYLLKDTSLNTSLWMSQKAIDSEASGYFLVPAGTLPSGWRAVGASEATNIWGSGYSQNTDPPRPCAKSSGCGSCLAGSDSSDANAAVGSIGMPVASINLQACSLVLNDRPVGYQPAFGPAVYFTFRFDAGDTTLPTSQNWSNLGSQVFCNWVGFIDFNPSIPSGPVTLHSRGGGIEPYQGLDTNTLAYQPGQYTGAILTQLSSTTFQRTFSDGSKEIYAEDDGSLGTSPNTEKRAFLSSYTDAASNTVTLTYDPQHRITSITDATGKVSTLAYQNASDPYKITKFTDPFGRFASFTYNTSGMLASSTDVLGLVTTFSYTGGTMIGMTTPYGTTSFTSGSFGGNDLWVQLTDPMGGVERAESWPMGAPNTAGSDPLGAPTVAPNGQAMSTVNGFLNFRTTYYWSKHAMMVDPGDYNSAYAYQFNHSGWNDGAMGNSLETEQPPGASRIWYNYPGQSSSIYEGTNASPSAIGRLVKDANGNTVSQITLKSYNALGNVTSVTDPVGRVTTYTYDTNGIDLTQIKQGSDTIYAATYNGQHLPLTVTDAAGQTTTYTYNSVGLPLTVKNPNNETTTYAYDGSNNLISITGPVSGATTTFTYDSVGRRQSVTDSQNYTLTYAYDNLDRVTSVTYPDNSTKQITYNRLDVASTTDREGRTSQQWYDANRHLILSLDPLGHSTQYNWCKCGVLEGLTDPNGNTTSFGYDPGSRLTSKTYADGKGNAYTYDLSGRLSTATDALGQVKSYQYNVDDTLAGTTYSNVVNSTPNVSMTWDTNYRRVTSITDGSGASSFAYYPATSTGGGKVSSITTPLTTIAYTYDALGRATNRQINGSANSQTLTYDALGRIIGMQNPLGSFTNTFVGATGRLQSITGPAGINSSYGYYGNTGSAGNEDERLSSITNSIGASVVSQFCYQYDVAGNVTGWSQLQPGVSTNAQSWANGYDAGDQLTAASITGSLTNQYGFTYDRVGNRLSQQQTGSSLTNAIMGGSFNNLNQLTSLTGGSGQFQVRGTVTKTALVTINVGTNSYPATYLWGTNFSTTIAATLGTNNFSVVAQDENTNKVTNRYQVSVTSLGGNRSFSYDADGNCLNDGIRSYLWDAENRLVSVIQGTNTYSFGYDYANRRVSEKLNGTLVKQSIWDGQVLSEERSSSNTVTKQFFEQGEMQNGTPYFYFRDHLGSVAELVNASGSVVAEYTYDPYGNATQVSGTNTSTFQYAGYYAHLGTGLDLTLYRAYDPVTGRWLSRDPLKNAELKQGLNLYEYVSDDPLSNVDPFGLYKVYGFWCGPDWTGGQVEQYSPNHPPGYYKPPIDALDSACERHDKCYYSCRKNYPCDQKTRKQCMSDCNTVLYYAAQSIGGFWGNVIKDGMIPPPDPGKNDPSCNSCKK